MHEVSDFKKGLKILIDGQPFKVVDFQHVKPGKGNQFTRTKLQNILTGTNLERTFRSGEKFEVPDVEIKEMNYLYTDDTGFNFMDMESFEQISMNENEVSSAAQFLIENLKVSILFFNERAVAVEVPKTVNLRVAETDPGLKGNTVQGGTKPAKLETGLIVTVPLHINVGDLLKIDTTEASYSERVNES